MRWLKCREIARCNYSLLPQGFENDDNHIFGTWR
jgi:hypothetical protein